MKTKPKKIKGKRSFMAYSLDILRYKKLITLGNIFCNSIIFSHQVAVNFCVRQVLNILEDARGFALEMVIPYLVGILGAALIRIAGIMGCAVLDALRSYYYQNRIKTNILRLLLKKSDITHVAGRSGANFEVLDNDVSISTFPAELFTEVSGHFVYTAIALTMLLVINWQLTLFIFLPLSAAIYGIQRLSARMKEKRQENRAAHDAASNFVSDVSNTVLAVKATGSEESVLNQYDSVNKKRRLAVLKDTLFNAKVNVLLNGAIFLGSSVIMFAASRLMTSGTFKIGDFGLFIANLGTLADCVSRIVELVAEARRAEVSYERILNLAGNENAALLNADAGIALRPNIQKYSKKQQKFNQLPLRSFEAKNLSFDYGDGNGFLDVSFCVGPGEMTVVAGGVGSGKSTLLSVLMGLLPPEGGELLLDGRPLCQNERTPVNIAGAPQRGGFFSTDLKENLCLGFPAPQDEMMEAISIAALAELVDGGSHGHDLNDIKVGSRGGKLSGGQLQRLSMARMLARGAQLNVIDDCISALDEETQNKVLAQLLKYLKKTSRSVIIATNEQSFLQAADQILFMERGRLVSQGSFLDLMDNAMFRELLTQS